MAEGNPLNTEIEHLKRSLDILLEKRDYNLLDPIVQQLSRKLDYLINQVILMELIEFDRK